ESVFAGRDVAIVSFALGAGIDPIVFEAIEFIFETDFFRGGKTKAGVMEVETPFAGGNLEEWPFCAAVTIENGLARGGRLADVGRCIFLEDDLFDEDGRRQWIDSN